MTHTQEEADAELRLLVRKEIQSLKDGLDTNAVNAAKCKWCEETEDNIMAAVQAHDARIMGEAANDAYQKVIDFPKGRYKTEVYDITKFAHEQLSPIQKRPT